MKILIASNFFKGSLSAIEAANIIEEAVISEDSTINICKIPIADGGDGTLDAIKLYTNYEEKIETVSNPLNKKVSAKWLLINARKEKTAIIEIALACGLNLLTPDEYNPLITTTFGVGELINKALENNCKKIIITLGGSSTNDGGAGMLQALGVELLDKDKNPVNKGGGELINIKYIDLSNLNPALKNVKIIAACDVNNPLCGKNGASHIYASQKGANNEQIKLLDNNLSKFADLTIQTTGFDFKNMSGAGAAGGLGFALKSFLNAELIEGFDLIADISQLEEKIKTSNAVITTEGCFDSQTLSGKAPIRVANIARKYNIPTIIIAGSIKKDFDYTNSGILAAFSLSDDTVTLEESIRNAPSLLKKTSTKALKLLKSNFEL